MTSLTPITLRAPSTLPSSTETPAIPPPSLSWLEGTWTVTHSSLPMWKKNQNVQITYKRVPNTSPTHIDDIVTYQPVGKEKIKTVHGVDKPLSVSGTKEHDGNVEEESASMAYQWRGKGWLMIASSKWETLGYGDEESTNNQWVVTYFAKTPFTPAGVDFYSRNGKLLESTVEGIKAALAGMGGDVANLAKDVFAITNDGTKTAP